MSEEEFIAAVITGAVAVRPHSKVELEMLTEWAGTMMVNAAVVDLIEAGQVRVEWGGDDVVVHKV